MSISLSQSTPFEPNVQWGVQDLNLCGLLAFGSTIRPLQPLGQPSHLRWPPEGPTHRFILRSLCISSFFSPRFTCTPIDRLPAHLHYALIQFSLNQWGQICLQSICMADFMQSCGHIIHLPPRNLNKFGAIRRCLRSPSRVMFFVDILFSLRTYVSVDLGRHNRLVS